MELDRGVDQGLRPSQENQSKLEQTSFPTRERGSIRSVSTPALLIAGVLAIFGSGITCHEYADYPGFGASTELGRTKNSLASIIGGIVAQKIGGNSNIEITVTKTLFPDAPLSGQTTTNTIDSLVDLTLTSSKFTATGDPGGLMKGKVDKSEFDWNVTQVSDDKWEIGRLGWKFDTTLELTVKDGVITGEYVRPGPHFNWGIEGTYDQGGNVKVEVSIPFSLDIGLAGKVTPK